MKKRIMEKYTIKYLMSNGLFQQITFNIYYVSNISFKRLFNYEEMHHEISNV